ncbi:MAG TPA: Flp pilus assembly protein CpaB [Planktothrix sp.]
MNPLRSLFVQLSRIPPAAMLVAILGLAVLVTTIVTDMLHKQEANYLAKQQDLQNRLDAKQTVVYAVKDIPEGQMIPSEALEERKIEAGKAPQDALGSATLASGHVAKYGIGSGQIISQHDLAPQLAQSTFESRLKDGMRAVTFAVDNNSGVAGFVTPESHIDIIGMVGNGAETKAAPILSDVEVIAVGQTYQRQQNGNAIPSSSVTVAVTPEDTQKLVKAVVASKLYLSLRNGSDHTPIATVDVTSLFPKAPAQHETNLVGLLPPPPSPAGNIDLPPAPGQLSSGTTAVPPPAPMSEIEQWSGGKKDVLSFPHTR